MKPHLIIVIISLTSSHVLSRNKDSKCKPCFILLLYTNSNIAYKIMPNPYAVPTSQMNNIFKMSLTSALFDQHVYVTTLSALAILSLGCVGAVTLSFRYVQNLPDLCGLGFCQHGSTMQFLSSYVF